GCTVYDSPSIGFVDCNTGTGGYGTLAVTQLPLAYADDHGVEWDTGYNSTLNYTVTSESSEFAGVPGTCGTGDNFDIQFTNSADAFASSGAELFEQHPGSCSCYCKVHGPALMRGVIIVSPGQSMPPTLNSLTPVNISTEPSVAQSFTGSYSDTDLNMTDASL